MYTESYAQSKQSDRMKHLPHVPLHEIHKRCIPILKFKLRMAIGKNQRIQLRQEFPGMILLYKK